MIGARQLHDVQRSTRSRDRVPSGWSVSAQTLLTVLVLMLAPQPVVAQQGASEKGKASIAPEQTQPGGSAEKPSESKTIEPQVGETKKEEESATPTEPKLTRRDLDVNFDGNVDQRQFFNSFKKLMRVEVDENQDGHPEQWQYYNTDEQLERVDFDTNGDGKIDQRKHFAPEQIIQKIEIDTNFDQIYDRVQFFNGRGKLQRIEIDSNNDGKPDEWEYYE